jgi:hypothetical protein
MWLSHKKGSAGKKVARKRERTKHTEHHIVWR